MEENIKLNYKIKSMTFLRFVLKALDINYESLTKTGQMIICFQ